MARKRSAPTSADKDGKRRPAAPPLRRKVPPASPPEGPAAARAPAQRIEWQNAGLRSRYANVCQVASNEEGVVLLFGLDQGLDPDQTRAQLTDRVLLSAQAAKQLAHLIDGVIAAYENRFGPLDFDPTGSQRLSVGPRSARSRNTR